MLGEMYRRMPARTLPPGSGFERAFGVGDHAPGEIHCIASLHPPASRAEMQIGLVLLPYWILSPSFREMQIRP